MRKFIILFLSLTLQLVLHTGCVSTDGAADPSTRFHQESGRNVSEPNKLAAGDTIQISVEVDGRMEVMAHEAQVSPEGIVTLPLIGDVKVENRTPAQARSLITKAYSDYYVNTPVVMLSLPDGPEDESEWGSVTVMGYVSQPGRVPIRSRQGINLTEAIQLAGNFAPSAKKSDIRITRTDELGLKTRISVDFNDIGKKGNSEADVLLIDGDMVYVPQRFL